MIMGRRFLGAAILFPALLTQLLQSTTTEAYNVQGKRVLVTGSSGGIGRGIALELAKAGAHVLVHFNTRQDGARETARLIEQNRGICAGIAQCDFCHPAHIHAMFQQINSIWPDGLDVLVNNAGTVAKLAMEDDDEYVTEWRDTLNINLNAPRLLSHIAVKGMKARGGGVIINVSSIHGEKSHEFMSAYAVSKAGLDMLTKAMAIEYSPYNVRVNAIAPGPVAVERSADFFRDPTNLKTWTDRLLIKKVGSVQDVAQATMPLITNDWITGTIWQVDGGMMARSNMPERARPEKPAREDIPDFNRGAPPTQARPGMPVQEFGGLTPPQQQQPMGLPPPLQQPGGFPQPQQGAPQQPGFVAGGRNAPMPGQEFQQRPGQGFVPMQDQQDYLRQGGGATSMPGRDFTDGGRTNNPGQGYIPRGPGPGTGPTYNRPLGGTGYMPEQSRQAPHIQPLDGTSNTMRGNPPAGDKKNVGLGGTSDPYKRPGEGNSGWPGSNWPNGPSF